MADNMNYDDLYSDYFSRDKETSDVKLNNQKNFNYEMELQDDPNDKYSYKNNIEGIPVESTLDYNSSPHSWVAEGSVSTVDELGELIENLLNSAWGSDWGMFGSEFKNNTDENELILPQITYDEHEREVASNKSVKPTMTDNIKETDQEGKPTGDSFQIYKQWFDVLLEFNVYGKDKREMRDIVNRFEMLLVVYMKFLKKKGVSEMIFLKYMSGSKSDKYNEDLDANMGSLLYLVKLERTTQVRTSTLNKLEVEVNKNS